MCRLREYHIVTLILFIKCLAFFSCGVRGEYTWDYRYRMVMTESGRTR